MSIYKNNHSSACKQVDLSQTHLTPQKQTSKKYLKSNKNISPRYLKQKSKSQINISKKCKNQQQLFELKQKVELSKDILTNIYQKVKKKQSLYELQISKQNLKISKIKKLTSDYKKLYQDGLIIVQNCIDRNIVPSVNQKNSYQKYQMKNKILEKIRKKKLEMLNVNYSNQKNNQENQKEKEKSPYQIKKDSSKKSKLAQTPFRKLQKSQSAANYSKKTSSYKLSNKQQIEKPKISNQPINHAEKIPQFIKKQESSSLYEIYKRRIQKRRQQLKDQKQIYQNDKQAKNNKQIQKKKSNQMGWIVQKLEENLNELKLIRKKSQIKLSKSSIKLQNPQKNKYNKSLIQNNQITSSDQQKKQKSRQKYLLLQQMKLKNISS